MLLSTGIFRGVSLFLRWKTSGSIPMGYTKYCNGYADYTIVNKLTNHLENKPGVKAEVDWSGPTMSYIDTSTGEVVTVYLFVGTILLYNKPIIRSVYFCYSNTSPSIYFTPKFKGILQTQYTLIRIYKFFCSHIKTVSLPDHTVSPDIHSS